jgi:hypothetical protein
MTNTQMEAYGKQLVECATRNGLDINDIKNVANVLYKEQLAFTELLNSDSGKEIVKFLGA